MDNGWWKKTQTVAKFRESTSVCIEKSTLIHPPSQNAVPHLFICCVVSVVVCSVSLRIQFACVLVSW